MNTHLHYALSEHVTGYSLFRIKEFDELTKDFSGHLNSFIKLVAHVNFNSLSESVENVQAISEGRVTGLLLDFLRQNVPAKDCTLGVNHSLLGENIQSFGLGFECICQEAVCEILRLIRFNYGRLMRSFVLQPGDSLGSSNVLKASSDASSLLGYKNIGATSVSERAPAKKAETRARLVVALSLARAILDVTQFLSATWICRSLELVDELDKSICKSTSSLRISYKLHFPELCQKGQQGLFSNLVISDFGFINLIADYTSRDSISKFLHTKPSLEEKAKVTSWFGGSDKAFDVLVAAARDSIGQELDVEDSRHLKAFAQHLLKLYETRETTYNLLASRIEALVPNMASLFNVALSLDSKSDQSSRRVGDRISSAILAARLISHAGRLDRLATMPSSRLLSLGASKAIFR
ncbi:unnamed protein product [Protopolystoma xenopodis]|uniref:Nucleolar protein 56 n=1 Tax=Protopolystoma xenopodis TaxID=117903 RepID=A0A448WSM4_9PLAT|nr:unnamed protein product [Protopolystoma xenopodis]